jgi:hypothetical protein
MPAERKMNRVKMPLSVLLPLLLCLAVPASGLAAREVPIDVLVFFGQGDSASGATVPVVVGLEPNPRKSIRVGFYEEVSGGTGAMWRAAGWMASVLSSLMLGVELTDYRISFDVGGRIDGPSAGGLFTTALMAAFLGDTVRPDATMTGIINPDGTIGPVGGIPHKIDGAARRGKKLILIPYGQRINLDLKLKQPVDVVERGRALGVEVREVRDISEAYVLLTGKPLPQPKPARDLPPEVPAAALAKVRDRAQALTGRYQSFAAQVKAAGQLDREFQQMITQAERAYSVAQRALSQGLFAVTYDRMVTANLMIEAVLLGITINRVAQQGGEPAIKNLFETLKSVVHKLDAFLKKLDSIQPRTLADGAALAEAYGMAAQAAGSFFLAQEHEGQMVSLKKAVQGGGQPAPRAPLPGPQAGRPTLGVQIADGPSGVLVSDVVRGSPAERAGVRAGDLILQCNGMHVPNAASLQQMIATATPGDPIRLLTSRAGQQAMLTAVLGPGGDQPLAPPPAVPALPAKALEQIGQQLYEAALFYRLCDLLVDLGEDRLIVGMGLGGTPAPAAEVVGRSAKLFQTSADAVMSYLDGVVLQERASEARMSLEAFRGTFMTQDPEYALAYTGYLALRMLSISESPYARLGPSMMLYAGAASLVAKYYSLGAEVGEGGTVKRVGMEKALVNMLDLAFKNARGSINLAKQSGVEPALAALYYEAARFLVEEDLDDKLTALTYLWQATAQARVLALLAGGLRPAHSPSGQPGQPPRTDMPVPSSPPARTPGR